MYKFVGSVMCISSAVPISKISLSLMLALGFRPIGDWDIFISLSIWGRSYCVDRYKGN